MSRQQKISQIFMRNRNLFTALLCLLISITFHNQSSAQSTPQTEARKYSNEFLNIGVGARAFGMGNAHAGIVDDVTAGYWNPAALAQEGYHLNPELSLLHASYFANIATYNYLGFTMPVDDEGRRRFGVSLIRIGVDNIPNTLELIDENNNIDFDRISSFSQSI